MTIRDTGASFGWWPTVEDLQQLELVVKVVFEPEHDFLEPFVPGQLRVPIRELSCDQSLFAVSACGQMAHADRRQFPERPGVGNGPVVQDVAPRQELAAQSAVAHAFHCDIAVGDVKLAGIPAAAR